MGAGILPVALHNDKLYLLFSREFKKRNGKEDWRDFGGTPENNETSMETAVREGWEESMGFLGSKKDIKNLINNKLIDKLLRENIRIFILYTIEPRCSHLFWKRIFVKTSWLSSVPVYIYCRDY